MADPTMEDVIKAYLQLRKQKDELVKLQKAQVAPLTEQIFKCQSWLHQQLISQGQMNARTAEGSCYLQTDTSAVVEDWNALLSWIKANSLWEFLEQRVSKSVVKDYTESTKTLPPGVKITSEVVCHVRSK